MSDERTVWIVGESDDYIAAAFTTEGAAQAYLDMKEAPIREKFAEKNADYGADYWRQFSHWWIDEIPLDPS